MSPQLLNAVGLLLNIVGVVLAFFYGFPQPTHEEGVSIGLQPSTPLQSGKTVAEHNAEVRERKARYLVFSRIALALILVGFALQLIAVCS